MVGADYTSFDFKEDFWFTKYEWSVEEEEKFRRWFERYLWWNRKAARWFIAFPWITSKENRKKAVKDFCFNFGWKYKMREDGKS